MPADILSGLSGSNNGSFDAVAMCNFIQIFSEDQAEIALKNVIKIIKPGGDLYIVGSVLDDNHLSPNTVLNMNIFFLNIYDGGQAYTEQQHRDWLAEAGFENTERTLLPDGRSIIVARKPS